MARGHWLFGSRQVEVSAAQLAATGAAGGAYVTDPVDGDRGYVRVGGGGPREQPWWTTEKARAYSVNAYRANPMARAIIDTYCVDESTEILTADGWRKYCDVAAGDEVLTLNHETGLSEWQPIESMHVFPAERRTLMLMSSRDVSALTTTNHRWPVVNRRSAWTGSARAGWKAPTREWRTSETLEQSDWFVRAAPPADAPAVPKWTDDLVELVAWTYTEGHVRDSGALIITQSHVVNSEQVDRIEAALRRAYGDPCSSVMRRDRWFTAYEPMWQRRDYGRNARFFLNREAAEPIMSAAPDKVPSFEWLRSLTPAQLRLFIDVSLMADGDSPGLWLAGHRGGAHLSQLDHRRAEAFQFALILSGIASGARVRSNDGHLTISAHKSTGTRVASVARTLVEHDGIVWCPKTANGTWFARRDGRTYFTGNTSFVVGDSGVKLQCADPQVLDVVQSWWTDARNRLDDLQTLLCRTWLLEGEQIHEYLVGEMTGTVRFSPIDPRRVKRVELDRGNPLWHKDLILSDGLDERALSIAALDDLTELRTGQVGYHPSWRATITDTRGVPFLSPVLDDLDAYATVLSNLIDRTALARYMVWDVTVEGDQDAVDAYVAARGGVSVPRSGTVEVHNSQVKWDTKTAQTGSYEDTNTSKAVLTNVAGGAGLAKTWLADPEDANRATALSMAEPVRRRVGGVQQDWLKIQRAHAQFVVDQAVRVGRLPRLIDVPGQDGQTVRMRPSDMVQVVGPEVAAADAQVTAGVLLNLSTALKQMVEAKVMTTDAAAVAASKAWEQFVGQPMPDRLEIKPGSADDVAAEIEAAHAEGRLFLLPSTAGGDG